jgi:hypothetical protein
MGETTVDEEMSFSLKETAHLDMSFMWTEHGGWGGGSYLTARVAGKSGRSDLSFFFFDSDPRLAAE